MHLPLGEELGTQLIAVVASVGDQGRRRWQCVNDEVGALVVAHLAFRLEQDDKPALAIARGMELGVQSAF